MILGLSFFALTTFADEEMIVAKEDRKQRQSQWLFIASEVCSWVAGSVIISLCFISPQTIVSYTDALSSFFRVPKLIVILAPSLVIGWVIVGVVGKEKNWSSWFHLKEKVTNAFDRPFKGVEEVREIENSFLSGRYSELANANDLEFSFQALVRLRSRQAEDRFRQNSCGKLLDDLEQEL